MKVLVSYILTSTIPYSIFTEKASTILLDTDTIHNHDKSIVISYKLYLLATRISYS